MEGSFSWKELLLKEALHISLTSEEQRFNRDVGLELQGCWVSTLKALRVVRHSNHVVTKECNY